jgi:hypothetical protein
MNQPQPPTPDCDQTGARDVGACPGLVEFQHLQTAFGSALVSLKDDVITRSIMLMGPDLVPPESIARNEPVTATRPAGVICGGHPKLMALVFRAEAAGKQFLLANPALATTLVMRARNVFVVWLKSLNGLPPNTTTDEVKVISNGVFPVFYPDAAVRYSIYQDGLPVEVDLDTLAFSNNAVKDFFLDWSIRQKHGPPLVQASPRRKELNPIYWAVWISTVAGLRFDRARCVFTIKQPENEETIFEAQNVPMLVEGMLQQACQANPNIPRRELNARRISSIVQAMRAFCVVTGPSEEEILQEFVGAFMERRAGATLTKNDATTACLLYRKSRCLGDYSENRLRYHLRLAIFKKFGIGQSNDAGRVFHGLALRSPGARATAASHAQPTGTPEANGLAPNCGSSAGTNAPEPQSNREKG